MLIPSANDAANILAEHVAGSIPAFAELMNKKATALGLTGSHFTNPSGVHDKNLYTTAYDLSVIARYAMSNEKFREIVKTPVYTIPATATHLAEDRTYHNSNLLLQSSEPDYYYKYTTGIKTGFTDPAGDCLVASAKKGNDEFIAVCLKGDKLENGLREKFIDCKTLFDFAFDNYTAFNINLQEFNEENTEINQFEHTNTSSLFNNNDIILQEEVSDELNHELIFFVLIILGIIFGLLIIILLFFR